MYGSTDSHTASAKNSTKHHTQVTYMHTNSCIKEYRSA